MGKIGIMGGTFDPIHNGHLLLGKQAYVEYDLDEIWFMPSGHPPHKSDHKVTDAVNRCDMTKLAIAEFPYFRISDFEVIRYGNTYTAKTLSLLKEQYPEHQFYFIIGADSLYEIERWYHPKQVMELSILLVAIREYSQATITMEEQIHYLNEKYNACIYQLHCPEVNISSEELRNMTARGKSLTKYVPKVVIEYIAEHHLYQENTIR